MPYKSDAQRRYFHWAKSQGKISPEVVEEYDKATEGKDLPERVKSKDKKEKKATIIKYTDEKTASRFFKLGFLNTVAKYIGYLV